MDQETKEMLQAIISGMEAMETRLEKNLKHYVDERIRHTEILIENDVSKRIDSLFDGYQLVHEKQWELEKKVDKLERRLELLEAKAG